MRLWLVSNSFSFSDRLRPVSALGALRGAFCICNLAVLVWEFGRELGQLVSGRGIRCRRIPADAFPAPTVQQVPQPFEFGLGLGALGDSFAEAFRLASGDVHLRED
jgi:hypothetical protein